MSHSFEYPHRKRMRTNSVTLATELETSKYSSISHTSSNKENLHPGELSSHSNAVINGNQLCERSSYSNALRNGTQPSEKISHSNPLSNVNGNNKENGDGCQGDESPRELRRKMRSREKQSEILGRGQLKLSILFSGNQLTVHALEAYGLKSQWQAKCNAYVQVEICHNDSGRSRTQSDVISGLNCPVFNERLTLTLGPEDERKRLLISVWHRDNTRRCSEFLGCLSFGLRHLVAKCMRTSGANLQAEYKSSSAPSGVQGWYYLLSADVGHRKHLLARGKSMTSSESCDQKQSGCCATEGDKENQDLSYENLTLTLKHRGVGYGFSVRGPHPVRVGRVKEGGPAQEAGLKKGDVIVKINGEPINDEDVERVAKVIRNSAHIVVIEVQRPRDVTSAEQRLAVEKHVTRTPTRSPFLQENFRLTPCYGEMNRSQKRMGSDFEKPVSKKLLLENSVISCNNVRCSNSQNNYTEGVFCKPCGKQMLTQKPLDSLEDAKTLSANHKACNICRDSCEHVTCIANELTDSKQAHCAENKDTKWNPDMSEITRDSVISAGKLVDSFDQHLMGLSYLASYKDLAELAREQYSCSFLNLGHEASDISRQNLTETDMTVLSTQQNDVTIANLESNDESVTSHGSLANESRSLYHAEEFSNCTLELGHLASQTTFECSMASEKSLQRELCVRTLLKCEQTYVQRMQKGIQAFARPLRVCITAQEKETLFQNVEKLVALSRYNLTQIDQEMTSSLHEETTLDDTHAQTSSRAGCAMELNCAYKNTVSMLVSAYREYIQGLEPAVVLLRTLLAQPRFSQLLQVQKKSSDIDLLEFLQQPVLHFEFLRRTFGELLSHADEHSSEYDDLSEIIAHFQETYRELMDYTF